MDKHTLRHICDFPQHPLGVLTPKVQKPCYRSTSGLSVALGPPVDHQWL